MSLGRPKSQSSGSDEETNMGLLVDGKWTINPTGIVAIGPRPNFTEPHGWEALGAR